MLHSNRVELAFKPASKPFITVLSRLQPATCDARYEFFSSLPLVVPKSDPKKLGL